MRLAVLPAAGTFSHSPSWPTHMSANILLTILVGPSQQQTGAIRSVYMDEGAVTCRIPTAADPHLNGAGDLTKLRISSSAQLY